MKSRIVGWMAVALLVAPLAVGAATITYTYSGFAQGDIGGNWFSQDIKITGIADTANADTVLYSSGYSYIPGYRNVHLSSTIQVGNVTYTIIDTLQTYNFDSWMGGLSISTGIHFDPGSELLVFSPLSNSPYDLRTNLGPTTPQQPWYPNPIFLNTSGGVLILTYMHSDTTFTATTGTPAPLPAAAWLLLSGLGGLCLLRRRKLH